MSDFNHKHTKNGRRVVIEIDEADCDLVAQSIRLARATRKAGKKLVGALAGLADKEPRVVGKLARELAAETPLADAREASLLELFTLAAERN